MNQNKRLNQEKSPKIILFNKPFNVVCQFSKHDEDLTLSDFINVPNVYPAGRLDKNSEGLLILTDDGELQHKLSHPRFYKKKYYWVQVEGAPKESDLEPLRQGLSYRHITYKPAKAKIIKAPEVWTREPPIRFRASIPTTWLEIIISEGKNHQIRKMTAAIGFPTLRLIRSRIGDWKVNNLKPGEYRLL